jgi:TusA-related sulfurtransferase
VSRDVRDATSALGGLPTPDRVLDLRGETCPYPPIYTNEELADMRAGEVLEVLTDNPPSIHTIPFYAAKQGHRLLADPIRRGAVYSLFFEAGSQPA